MISVYEGIKRLIGKNTEVNYALGCHIRNLSYRYMEKAKKLASESDVVILVLGGSSTRNFKTKFESNGAVKTSYDKDEMNCGENVDKASLKLDGIQEELFNEIRKVNSNIVTILIQGRPHSITSLIKDSKAILCAWYPGNLGGLAIAETLVGNNNPSGRLSMTIPRSSMQIPCFYNGKDLGVKRNYSDMTGKPLYPFGYGLSYSQFVYQNIHLSHEKISIEILEKQGLTISLDVLNKSNYDGYEVIQIYTIDKEASITRRYLELKAFQKVFIKAHKRKSIEIFMKAESFRIWNNEMKYVIEKGCVDILIAKNSEDYIVKSLVIEE